MIRRGIGVQSFVSAGVPTDADAQAFITAAGITDATQQSAINTLVTDLKTYGIWSKMKAIYPIVGGTASAHKWNLKDPRDLDAAFRLVFSGGWTHSSNGATPNGTNGYADTFLIPSTSLSQNSTHLSYYSRTNNTTGRTEMGARTASGNECYLLIRYDDQQIYGAINRGGYVRGGTLTTTASYLIGSRLTSTTEKYYWQGSLFQTLSQTSANIPSHSIHIGAKNVAGTANDFNNRQCAFASIGDGLTDTEAANLYTAVQAYQTSLSRNV